MEINGYQMRIVHPKQVSSSDIDTVVYLFAHPKEENCFEKLKAKNIAIVNVLGYDWNRDLSPWPAERVFAKGEDFGGMAGDFLNILSQTIIPTTEKALNADVKTRVVAGYSMGGLFAIYACLQTDLFDRAASMSGSLWYDGFADYVTGQTIPANLSHVFFSLGKRERLTKNMRMANVEKCTIRIREYFECAGVHTKYEVSEGGHFDHVPQRIAHGIEEILEL